VNYKLVISEKPSVAQSIAKVMGATDRHDGYMEGNGYLVSWCIGHLIELAQPQEYDEKYEKWKKEDLPIIPRRDDWKYIISEATKKQFQVLKDLMKRDDVESIIEATDAGREGELIFRLVYHKAGCKKPFERLWISSMEDIAVREGFQNLKQGTEYDALYEAALCRERADWIVGINCTRLFSTLYGQTLNVGRVMTPTLAMIVSRENEITGFKPETFYSVQVTAGSIEAVGERTKDKAEALNILDAIKESGKATVTRVSTVQKTEKPPLLYDLTSLQRDANKCYGFTAQQTLNYIQSLYEKKLVTYPRTDSRYLTDEMDESTTLLSMKMKEKYGYTKNMDINVKPVINGEKISDHHAIIPTENVAEAVFTDIPIGEQKILGMITARLLSAVGKSCSVMEYHLELSCAGHFFKANARAIVDPGWRDIQNWILGKDKMDAGERDMQTEDSDKNSLADIIKSHPDIFAEGRSLPIADPILKEGKTAPAKRYTEDTLLSSMERAGADNTPEEAERKGLGTSATRAEIIEKLIRIGFLERKGDKKTKYLVPTHKGITLITVIPEIIRSPDMTAEWEQKLVEVEHRGMKPDLFIREIEQMVNGLVQDYKIVKDAEALLHPECDSIGICPVCGSEVIEKQKGFFCSNAGCKFALWKNNRFFDSFGKKINRQVAESLLLNGRADLKKCRSVKTGKTFDTTVVLSTNDKGQAQFSLDFTNKKK
jgi:DNA topoisomerase-3